MSCQGRCGTNNASSTTKPAAATLPPLSAPLRRSPQNRTSPSPVKQTILKKEKKKGGTPKKKQMRSIQQECKEMEEEKMGE
eukprot:9223049-Ditylum_brightwellii.AAC.1